VKSHWSTSGNCTECMGKQLREGDLGYCTLPLFLNGSFFSILTLLVMYL
jgi:hypothetical protein